MCQFSCFYVYTFIGGLYQDNINRRRIMVQEHKLGIKNCLEPQFYCYKLCDSGQLLRSQDLLFTICKMEGIADTLTYRVPMKMNEIMCIKHLARGIAHNKHATNGSYHYFIKTLFFYSVDITFRQWLHRVKKDTHKLINKYLIVLCSNIKFSSSKVSLNITQTYNRILLISMETLPLSIRQNQIGGTADL